MSTGPGCRLYHTCGCAYEKPHFNHASGRSNTTTRKLLTHFKHKTAHQLPVECCFCFGCGQPIYRKDLKEGDQLLREYNAPSIGKAIRLWRRSITNA